MLFPVLFVKGAPNSSQTHIRQTANLLVDIKLPLSLGGEPSLAPGQEMGIKLLLSQVKSMTYTYSCDQSNQSYDLHYDLQS